MNTLPPLISQEESDRKRITPDKTGCPTESDEPPRKKLRSNKRTDDFPTPVKLKTPEDPKNEEKTKDSPGMKFICKICSVCKRTKELIEKHCLENHGKIKVYAQVTRRKQRFRAKKSLITDEYEEELKTLKMWYCAYCEYEDNSQNGLKAHLSKGFHNAEDLHERSVNVFGNVAPFKCIVCFARFISSDLLRIHTATHTGKELLDRCIDFSTTMVDHDKDEKSNEITDEKDKTKLHEKNGKPMFMVAKKGIKAPRMGMTMDQMILTGALQIIETDSETDSDSEEDTPLSQLSAESADSCSAAEDVIPTEDIINFSFEDETKKQPNFPKPKLHLGLKCFICENIFENENGRATHLKENHKIEMNFDLLSFNFQAARREMEEIDLLTPDGKLVRKISSTGVKRTEAEGQTSQSKGRKNLKGRTSLKCQFCDRVFPSYESDLFEKHENLHKETFKSPLNMTVPTDWLKTNNNTQSLPMEPEIPF